MPNKTHLQHNILFDSILDDEFALTLAKSADLYKIGSNSVLDPAEIFIGLKVVPRAVMSLLISELGAMEVNSSKDIDLPFGDEAKLAVNKNAEDDYTGSIYSGNKLVYDFMNRSIPGLGIILLSTFELYDMDELNKPEIKSNDNVQKLIDERMELHSLVSKVVEDKIAQREAIHKLMMAKLSEVLKQDMGKKSNETSSQIQSPPGPKMHLNVEAEDMAKRESKKEFPLKKFLDRKKKPQEYNVEISKSESVNCPDCNQTIWGNSGYAGCLCLGQDQNKKIWIKKTEDGIQIKFSSTWDSDNIEMLLETLRRKNR